ncbi:hypothetical protein HanPI659440_Chr10g0398311 [Helianthus annuus]|nr:hypothetical protein HanPI659440_Chr10g0398311 [Helianthus annuus]
MKYWIPYLLALNLLFNLSLFMHDSHVSVIYLFSICKSMLVKSFLTQNPILSSAHIISTSHLHFLDPTSIHHFSIKSSVSFPGVMAYNSTHEYLNIVDRLTDVYNIPNNITDSLLGYLKFVYRSELEDRYSAPMLWIGMYIALASLVCILFMVADLLHGLRSRMLWVPSKYFTINSASLTAISIAMKLPVDLTGSMPGYVDQVAKLGSMAFMCTMMANLLPCLGTMDSNELLSNITALGILVITLVVNVCIQMQTGAVSISTHKEDPRIIQLTSPTHISTHPNPMMDSKYQKGHDIASKHIQPSPGKIVTVDELEKHVRNHWVMLESSRCLHFITACFNTTSASGVICVLVTILHTYTMSGTIKAMLAKDYDSDYRWSMLVILIVQSIGVLIGTIVPLSRCFATLSFEGFFSIHFKVFKVERYWTDKLNDWKQASIRLPFHSRRLNVVIETSKRLFIYICIQLQKGVVVLCKIIALIPLVFVMCVCYCWMPVFSLWISDANRNIKIYVLYFKNGMWVGERTVEGFSKSVNPLIQKGAKGQPNYLIKLIREKSTVGFHGVAVFDQTDDCNIPSVFTDIKSSNCWRLAVVTLTTIAVSLPEIEKEEVDCLLECVREGLLYVTLVEKNLNFMYDSQQAAETLWREISTNKWLRKELQNPAFQKSTAGQIVKWFRDNATHYLEGGSWNEDMHMLICVNSMYRITETILHTYNTIDDGTVSQKELFDSLSSMIADIIAACLTNLPQIIIMKCHYMSAIKERRTRVKDAAQLLGETTEIIRLLQDHRIPRMNPSDMPFLNKWRAYFRNPSSSDEGHASLLLDVSEPPRAVNYDPPRS